MSQQLYQAQAQTQRQGNGRLEDVVEGQFEEV
jgi:hypothetical protein